MCAGVSPDQTSPAVNVFVTGQPGIGKTTLVLDVAKELPQDCIAGFYTVEAKAPGTNEKLGLDVVTFSGERAPLSRLRRGCGPKIGKYYMAFKDFERVVIPQLTPSKKIKLHIIDEVGRLGLGSPMFKEAIFKLLDSPIAVFGSIPAPRFGHTINEVEQIKQRHDTAVLTLTKANKAITTREITKLLLRLVKDAKDEDEGDEVEENGAGPSGEKGWEPSSEKGQSSLQNHALNVSSSSEDNTKERKPLEAALAEVAAAILED